jgi:hypothetical protein
LNTPKAANRHNQLDRNLGRTLSHWAEQQAPPISARRELMRTVRQEAVMQGHHVTRLPSDGFIETVYLGPVITFNHAFSMLYTLHSRVRL